MSTTDTTARAAIAVVGHGGATLHLAYYVGDNLTGTYCNRAAHERSRVRPFPGKTADDATCTRCARVAASPDSVPAAEGRRLAVVPDPTPAGPTHNPAACAVRGCTEAAR